MDYEYCNKCCQEVSMPHKCHMGGLKTYKVTKVDKSGANGAVLLRIEAVLKEILKELRRDL